MLVKETKAAVVDPVGLSKLIGNSVDGQSWDNVLLYYYLLYQSGQDGCDRYWPQISETLY